MIIPKPLIDDIASGKCLPFIGAGFSLNAHLQEGQKMPDWVRLTEILARIARVSPEIGGPMVASEYERLFGRVQLIEAIRKSLFTDYIEPGKAHKVFAKLPFDTIYTTNFDLLLEDAYNLIKKPYRSLVGELQMPFHGGPLATTIVKMHGDLRHEEHIIITHEDYESFLEKYPVISTHLSAMLITKTALFIGYSLTDPDFRNIREVIRSRLGRFERMSYIFQFNKPDKEIRELLNEENLHVININLGDDDIADNLLANYFSLIIEELDSQKSKEFRTTKPEIFEELSEKTLENVSRDPDASSLLSSSSNLCFVLMPISKSFDLIYKSLIYPVVSELGLEPLRADEIMISGSIYEKIRTAIREARIIIADITGRNQNVIYELGIAQSFNKSTILLTQTMDDMPSNLEEYYVIVYGGVELDEASKKLSECIKYLLGNHKLKEAETQIQNGMYRAAAANLGIYLESALKEIINRYELVEKQDWGRFSKKLTLGQMGRILNDSNKIDDFERKNLQKIIDIRNKAVHELVEPEKEDVLFMLDKIKTFNF